jgi:hypothetical protein
MSGVFAVLFVIFLFAPASSPLGDLQVLSDILEERIRSRRPEWELLNKHVDDDSAVLQWQNALPEKETYLAIIKITPSDMAAAKVFANPLPTQAGNIGTEILGIGQEARLRENKPGAEVFIEFRERHFIVRLQAPSEPKGKRLAKYIVDSIAALRQRK